MRKRKVNYPVARTATRQVPNGRRCPATPDYVRSTVAEINLAALTGRDDIRVGDRVRIGGGGLYAGELAVVESIVGGLIPAAIVRTEAGKTRRVRAVDLRTRDRDGRPEDPRADRRAGTPAGIRAGRLIARPGRRAGRRLRGP